MPTDARFDAFKEELSRLVDAFHKNVGHYEDQGYDESSLRNDFLNPFWRALGWDIENRAGLPQPLRDVQVETRVHIAGRQKRADYIFRTDGIDRFVSEAKRPTEELTRKSAYQAQRYAFNLKLLIAALTNFETFQVFVVGGRPEQDSPWDVCRQWHYTEYKDRAEEIWNLFAHQNVAANSLDRFIASFPKKPLNGKARQGWLIALERVRTVDAEFLAYIEQQRVILAKDLLSENKKYKWTSSLLNECTQRILDRILFIRICEDRDIDTGRSLELIVQDWESMEVGKPPLYRVLVSHFRSLDESFNGALFRKGHESENVAVSDEYLADFIKDLSSEDSPYLFSTLPVEILGQVYERFIGKAVRLTRGRNVKVELKPEARKAEGVYYTPRYVVDYIVERTVGKLLEGKAPKDVAKVKVVDPACGSGSFLLRVFERICEHYLRWLQQHPEQQRNENCYRDEQGNLHLTTHLKRQIMLQNVYGVDLDSSAVEVTMLSLYLKILEGETRTTLGKQQTLFPKETFLPNLTDNIKCGNSLIANDYYKDKQMMLGEDPEARPINAFEWDKEFPWVNEPEKFTAVVGNPPWGAEYTEDERKYLAHRYKRSVARMIDSYIYFIDQATRLLNKNASLSFIIPSTMLNQVDAKPIREILLNRGLSILVSLGQGIFGPKPLNTSTIFVSEPRKNEDLIAMRDLSMLSILERQENLFNLYNFGWKEWKSFVTEDPHFTFFVVNDTKPVALLTKLRKNHPLFSQVINGEIQRGVSPDVVEMHVLSKKAQSKEKLEKDILRKSLSGTQIKRYQPWTSDQYIIYATRETDLREYPRAAKYIKKSRKLNTCKEVKRGKHPWWAVHRAREPKIFTSPKFIGLTTKKTIELVYDEKDSLYVTDAMYVFSLKEGMDPWAAMAVLQAKLFLFLYRVSNQGESRVIPQVKAAKLGGIPFPNLRESKYTEALSDLSKRMCSLNEQLAAEKSEHGRRELERRISSTDAEIDELVYKAYGLNEAETKLVEEFGLIVTSEEEAAEEEERESAEAVATV
jgi:type I restriction-modification system DNA methylase subunit